MFLEAKNALVFKKANETLMIEPWGKDSLRVRSTLESAFIDRDVVVPAFVFSLPIRNRSVLHLGVFIV